MGKKFDLLRRGSDAHKLAVPGSVALVTVAPPVVPPPATSSTFSMSPISAAATSIASSSEPCISTICGADQESDRKGKSTVPLKAYQSHRSANGGPATNGHDPLVKLNSERSSATKSSSCDDIARVGQQTTPPEGSLSKKNHFPYAFLRSKLSVLPEENGGSVINYSRIKENLLRTGNRGSIVSLRSDLDSVSITDSQLNISGENGSDVFLPSATDSKSIGANSDAGIMSRNNSIKTLTDTEHSFVLNYQRLSSCLSSNESGYDSDGRHTEDKIDDASNTSLSSSVSLSHHQHQQQQQQLSGASFNGGDAYVDAIRSKDQSYVFGSRRRLSSSSSSIVSGVAATNGGFDCGTIRRRFRQIKLVKQQGDDTIGIELTPQTIGLDEGECETRYLVTEIDPEGIAYK
uniref:Uncharacterized protein n=1 Tax=Anopheles melas TaxID=34690 RepID=A0A182TEQ2_9DIPT